MARLQDFQTVTPTSSDKLLVVQSQGQGLVPYGSKLDSANPTGTGNLTMSGDVIIKSNVSVYDAIKTETGTVTMSSGYTALFSRLKKINGIVYLTLIFSCDTVVSSRKTIASLPQGYKPPNTLGITIPASTQANYYANLLTNVLIASNGDIIIGDLILPSSNSIKEGRITVAFST